MEVPAWTKGSSLPTGCHLTLFRGRGVRRQLLILPAWPHATGHGAKQLCPWVPLTSAVWCLAVLDVSPRADTLPPPTAGRGVGTVPGSGHVSQPTAGHRARCPRAPGCEAPIHGAGGELAGQLPIVAGAEWRRGNGQQLLRAPCLTAFHRAVCRGTHIPASLPMGLPLQAPQMLDKEGPQNSAWRAPSTG